MGQFLTTSNSRVMNRRREEKLKELRVLVRDSLLNTNSPTRFSRHACKENKNKERRDYLGNAQIVNLIKSIN